MIQDIGLDRYHNEYRNSTPSEDSRILCYKGRELLALVQDGELSFLTYGQVKKSRPELDGQYRYLFAVDHTEYYLIEEPLIRDSLEEGLFPGASWEPLEILRTAQPKEAAFAGVTGSQLAGWYESRRYCPKCGKQMVHDGRERMMRCESCGQMEYPKISPAVIVGVTKGDKILLTKYAGRSFKKYALIAGFAEIGETIEETVKREVMEEVGLRVKNIRYYKSQPWSFTSTLLMGFFAEVDGPDEIRLDEEELSVAEWCARDQVPEDDGVSLTREMMGVFKRGNVPE